MRTDRSSIGVFDSGFGGLNILRGIVKLLPQYDYIYLGDSARAPYGTRNEKQIYRFTKQAVEFLFSKNCPLVILACNTASAEALSQIQQHFLPKHFSDRRVLGVIIPAAEAAIEFDKQKIGVMATPSTVASKAFIREIAKLDPTLEITQQACPKLVPLIESGHLDSGELNRALHEYLTPLFDQGVSNIILGCTHYGLIERNISRIAGPKIRLINEANVVPHKLKKYLFRHPEIENKLSKKSKRIFFSTKPSSKFDKLGSLFFGQEIHATKVKLG